MAGHVCKCRFCQAKLTTDMAYKTEIKKLKAYFCNEEHYNLFMEGIAQKEAEKVLKAKAKQEEEFANREKSKKYQADKDKAYWLICEIIGRKEIINTGLWKEWKMWNKVASNEVIGNYLEENKQRLIDALSRIEDVEFVRIRYLSSILKNHLSDYERKSKKIEKPVVQADEIDGRDDVGLRINKKNKTVRRKGFAEMEG